MPVSPPPDDSMLGVKVIKRENRIGSGIARLLLAREASVVVVLIILFVLLFLSPQLATIGYLSQHIAGLAQVRDNFYSQQNIQNMLLQIALLSVYSIGETVVIITGGIDLSLGSLIGFSGMVLGMVAVHFFPQNGHPSMSSGEAILIAIAVALAVSIAVGALQGTLVDKMKLPAFVVTLASLVILRSQALVINQQLPITLSQFPSLLHLADGHLFANTPFAIPIPFALLIVIAVIAHVILTKTTLGRYLYSVGSNEQASRLSGINVSRVKLFAYTSSALLGGIAGVLYAGYGAQGDPQAGVGYELNAVAATVIGGASLFGGQGSIPGTILGAVLLQVLLNAINLTLSNPSIWQGSVVGGVLLMAVLVGAVQQRKQGQGS